MAGKKDLPCKDNAMCVNSTGVDFETMLKRSQRDFKWPSINIIEKKYES